MKQFGRASISCLHESIDTNLISEFNTKLENIEFDFFLACRNVEVAGVKCVRVGVGRLGENV